MSLRSRSSSGAGRPPRSSAYLESFFRDVYRLIARGYSGLNLESLADKEEPAITGLLVQAIERYLDDPESPDWTGRYSAQEERPIHASVRQGKARSRVDVEIESSGRRPRPRFQFEAKRLRSTDSKCVASYLGDEGLGCFLSGRYAPGNEHAGMLGYVQSGSTSEWVLRIRRRLEKNGELYRLAPGSEALRAQRLISELEHSYRSRHARPSLGDMDVHHVLLLCHVEA